LYSHSIWYLVNEIIITIVLKIVLLILSSVYMRTNVLQSSSADHAL